MSLITRVHRSTLLLLSFLVSFGIFCVTGALPYGESESADAGGDISLTGTIISGGDLGTVWLGATGSTSGLKFNANTNTFTGSMYSSQIGIIYINSGSSNGMKINGDLKATSSSLDLASPISFYSPAVGIITGGVGAKVDGSTKKISSVYPLKLSNSPGLGPNILTISGITLLPTPHNIVNGDLGTGVYIASGSIDIRVDSVIDAPYNITLTDINDVSRTHSTGSMSDSITVNNYLVKTSGEYSYELTDKNGNISRGKIRIIAAKLDSTVSSITNDTSYPASIKIADNSKQYGVAFYPKDEFGNNITGNEYLDLKATRILIGGYKLNSIGAPYSPASSESSSWSPHTLASNENSLSGSSTASNKSINATTGVWFGFSSKSPNGSTKIRLDLETQKIDGTSLSNLSQISSTYTFKPLIAISSLTLSPNVSVRQAESVMRPIYTQTGGGVTDAKITYIITSIGSSDEMEIRQVGSPYCSDLNQGISTACGWINASGGTTLSSTLQYTLSTQSGSHEVGVTFSGGTSTNTGYLTAIAEYSIGGSDIVTLLDEHTFTIDDTPPAGPKVIILGQYGSSQLGQSLTGGVDLLSSDLFIRERDKIRKQAKVMRSYTQTPSGTAKIQADTMTNSGILIVEGDIEIDSNIWDWNITSSTPNPPPKIIIALKKSDGTGGNIYIKNNVKNIAASLIADGSIFGDTAVGNSDQLYIYGTIISNNTIGGTNTTVCPRFLNLDICSAPGDYDLENLRNHTAGIGDASDTPNSAPSIIIQADPRLSGSSPLLILQGR